MEKWRYFTGYNENYQPLWSNDISKRSYVYIFPDKSADGKLFWMVLLDAMKNEDGRSHTVNYLWNQMEIRILLDHE